MEQVKMRHNISLDEIITQKESIDLNEITVKRKKALQLEKKLTMMPWAPR
jgi:hypothetical protein